MIKNIDDSLLRNIVSLIMEEKPKEALESIEKVNRRKP